MSNRYQTPGKRRSRAWLWLLLLGAIIGAALLAGTATVMHKTSDTEFCISCHSMEQPLADTRAASISKTPRASALNVLTVTFHISQSIIY